MYHLEPQKNQRFRPRASGLGAARRSSIDGPDLTPAGCDLASTVRSRHSGNAQFLKRPYATEIVLDSSCESGLVVDEDFLNLGFRRSSWNKVSGTTVSQGMSKEVGTRRPSPGVVAKLMGLDAMSSHVSKTHKERGNSRRTSTSEFKEKYATCEDNLFWTNTIEDQEIKDVFEVVETLQVQKHKNQKVRKAMPYSNRREVDVNVTEQEFIDAKNPKIDETCTHSEEFDGAILYSSKELLFEFLQEPNSLFSKHLHDLNYDLLPRHESDITILKSCKGTQHKTSELSGISRRNPDRCTHKQRDVTSSSRKHTTSYGCHSLREHSCYLPNKLSQSRYGGTAHTYSHPTEIVVLKPGLRKAQNTLRAVPSAMSHEDFHFDYKKHGRRSGTQEFNSEVGANVSNHTKKVPLAKFNGYTKDESSCRRSGVGYLKQIDPIQQKADQFDDCGNSSGSSSSYSIESSVNREARKRLCKRWKMAHRFGDVGRVGRRSSTLGEMLALSDTVSPNLVDDRSIATFDTRSMDGWKNSCSTNLPRFIPSSSTLDSKRKPSRRKHDVGIGNHYILKDEQGIHQNISLVGRVNRKESSLYRRHHYFDNDLKCYSGGEEDKQPEREIHANSEKLRKKIHDGYLAAEKPVGPELSEDATADKRETIDNVLTHGCNDVKLHYTMDEDLVKKAMNLMALPKDGVFSSSHEKDIVTKAVEYPRIDPLPSRCNTSESVSPASSDEADRPSPVSVLELPYEVEKQLCFTKIAEGLQGLRLQLRLLKSDSDDKYVKESEFLELSDEEIEEDDTFELLQSFRDEEERDYLYLLDLVIKSGVHCFDSSMFFSACNSPEYPVGVEVYDKLEKKYGFLVSWSKEERKLLFDLINSILLDFVAHTNPIPWVRPKRSLLLTWTHEGFVEQVWQLVVKKKKELREGASEVKILESMWLDVGIDVHDISRDIERMLKDELLDELFYEFISTEV